MQECEMPLAVKFFEKAVERDANCVEALDLMGECLIAMGDLARSHQILSKSVELNPNDNYKKYTQLAQLSEGTESLNLYHKALQLLNTIQSDTNELQSSIYSSIAELYMTDLCDEQDAESACETSLSKALSLDPRNPDALASLANLRMIQGNIVDATVAIDRIVNIINEAEEDESQYIDFGIRLSIAKMLIELSRWEEASAVLEGLLHEDDSVLELWYLSGIAYAEFEPSTALAYFQRTLLMLEKENEPDTAELRKSVEQAIQSMSSNPPDMDIESR